jgi:hypothetical protein
MDLSQEKLTGQDQVFHSQNQHEPQSRNIRLFDHASVFEAEVFAIHLAILLLIEDDT